jgi:signal transduction histidine kinase
MKINFLAIAGGDERAADVARVAMDRAFPGAVCAAFPELAEALASPAVTGAEILALLDPQPGQLALATAARGADLLPRWAVVARGGAADAPEAETVPPADWTPEVMAHIFRLAWAGQLLRRENERFRGDLMAIGTRVAHDLRSPLSGILSTTEALVEYLAQVAPDGVERTRPIINCEEEILQLVRALSQLAGDFAGPTTRAGFNMGAPAAAALEQVEPKLLAVGDSVSQPESWPDVVGDERKAQRIWLLLLQNAVTHAGAGRRLELSWRLVDGEYWFSLADDGKGIPTEKRDLLFWPFHRLSEPGAARGLGLPVVERLARLQGGRCEFRPRPGGGAEFSFSLPA